MILKNYSKYNYPLLSNTLSKEDISSAKKVLNSRQITMSNITYDFEKKFDNTQVVEDLGFFIGLHTNKITNYLSKYIAFHLLKIDEL